MQRAIQTEMFYSINKYLRSTFTIIVVQVFFGKSQTLNCIVVVFILSGNKCEFHMRLVNFPKCARQIQLLPNQNIKCLSQCSITMQKSTISDF